MTNDKSPSEIPEQHEQLEAEDPQDTPPSDLAELYPADAELWKDQEIVSTWEAVLLSLGIEPNTIRDLAEQLDPDNDEDRICYGQQTVEYNRRNSAIQNALAAGTLIPIQTTDPRYSNHIQLKAFVAWARDKAWELPAWLLDSSAGQRVAAPKPSSNVREASKAKTLARREEFQAQADALHVAHPGWSALRIATEISRAILQSRNKEVAVSTIRNNIKIKS